MAEKLLTIQELRALPETDLRAQVAQLRHALWEHRQKVTAGALQQTHLLPAVRRQIARLETILSETRNKTPVSEPQRVEP